MNEATSIDRLNRTRKAPFAMIRRLLCPLLLALSLASVAACATETATEFPGVNAIWVPGHDAGWRWVPGHWA